MSESFDDPGQVACWVLGQLWNPSGRYYPAGDFGQLLIDTVKKSDPRNRARLRLAFPIVTWAMDLYQMEETGLATLEFVADSFLAERQGEAARVGDPVE